MKNLLKRYHDYRKYVTTVRELENLSERDLRDLGIARNDIRFIAKQHQRGESLL